jgi:hypothetical protein
MVTLKISPYTNVTLTFDFDFGLEHPDHGWIWVREPYTEKKERNCQTKKLKSGHEQHRGPAPRQTGRQTVDCSITWSWTCVIALQITNPSSRQRGRPTSTNSQLSKNNQLEKGKNWFRVPDGCLTPRRTGRLTVSRNITLMTLTLTSVA